MSKLEDQFLKSWIEHRLPGSPPLKREYTFSKTRRFRFDFCLVSIRLAIEIDGFGYGHQSIAGLTNSHTKQNLAIEEGWTVIRFTSSMLGSKAKREECIKQVNRIILNMTNTKQNKDGTFTKTYYL